MIRQGRCPSCGAEATLELTGIQEGFEELPAVSLWLCGVCRSSVSGRRFLSRAEERRLVQGGSHVLGGAAGGVAGGVVRRRAAGGVDHLPDEDGQAIGVWGG